MNPSAARALVTDVVCGVTGGLGSRFGSGVGVGTRGTEFGFGLGPQAASSIVAVSRTTSARISRRRPTVAESTAGLGVGVSVRSIHRVPKHRPCPIDPVGYGRLPHPRARIPGAERHLEPERVNTAPT
jgi:hypothetical protein